LEAMAEAVVTVCEGQAMDMALEKRDLVDELGVSRDDRKEDCSSLSGVFQGRSNNWGRIE